MAPNTDPNFAQEPLLQFFDISHVHEAELAICERYNDMAYALVGYLPRSAERTVALRKLLESKDAALRARTMRPAPAPKIGSVKDMPL